MPLVRKHKSGETELTEYPLTVAEIASWYRSKQRSLAGSAVSLVEIRERAEYLPAADFDGANTIGRINAWVTGEFDFEALRVSDGKDIFSRHVTVSMVGGENVPKIRQAGAVEIAA